MKNEKAVLHNNISVNARDRFLLSEKLVTGFFISAANALQKMLLCGIL